MIAINLLQTGILQFGHFIIDGQAQPYRLRLEMLPAYPELLQQITYRGVQTLAAIPHFDRLVCTPDTIPLASALSLNLGVSLVYSQGHGESPVNDLVGAYDVGHPACLLVNSITPEHAGFLVGAHRVGLEIHSVVELVAQGETLDSIDQFAMFTLPALLHELQQSGLISPDFAATINAEHRD